jgi:hypothetical protein
MLEFRINTLNFINKFSRLYYHSYLKTDRLSKLVPGDTSRAQEYLMDGTHLLANSDYYGVFTPMYLHKNLRTLSRGIFE